MQRTDKIPAIENARLYERTAARLGRLEVLRELEGHISAQLDLERLLDLIARSALRLIGGECSAVFLREGEILRPRAWHETGDWFREATIRVGSGVIGAAVERGQGLIVNDDSGPPPEASLPGSPNARLLVQPLLAGERSLGAMVIHRDLTMAPFSADDLGALADFAISAAVAIENARRFAEASRNASEYRELFAVGGLVSSTLSVDRVLDVVVERSRALMGARATGIFKADMDAGTIFYERGMGLSPEMVEGLRLRVGEGTTGRAIEDQVPVWSEDILADPSFPLTDGARDLVHREGYHAVLSVPILIKGDPWGALAVYWWEPHSPAPFEVELLSALATQAAVALENARLYEAVAVRNTRLRSLARLNQIVSSSLDTDEVLRGIAGAAVEIMEAPVVSFWVADEPAQTLELRSSSDEGGDAGFPVQRLRFGEGGVGWVATHRRFLHVPDVFADDRITGLDWWQARGLRSFLGVPIVFQDSLLGVLSLNGRRPFDLEPDDQGLLESFVAQAAVAIRNARLYAEATRRLEESRALLEVSEILNSTLDTMQLLKRVAIKIAQVCHVDRCSIELWDGNRLIPLMAQFADGHKDEKLWGVFKSLGGWAPRDVPAHGRAIDTRCPVVIPDTSATDLIPRDWVATYGIKAYLSVPLVRQDQVIGVMNLDSVSEARAFEAAAVELAMAIAGQLALSIENTRLYSEVAERLKETTTLLAVSQALSQSGPPEDVMRRAAREITHAFGADTVGIYALDDRKERLTPVAGHHVPKALVDVFRSRPIVLSRHRWLLEACRDRASAWSSDVLNDPRVDHVSAFPPHSVLFTPTAVRGETVGGLVLIWWSAGRPLRPAEIRLVEGVASQVGLCMENAKLSRQTQLKLEETETLLAVSRTLSSTLDLETLPRQLLRHVARALGAESAGIWMLEEDGEQMSALGGYHIPKHLVDAYRGLRLSILRHPFYAEAARNRRSAVSTDVMADSRIPEAMKRIAPQQTQLFVPIVAKDRFVGGFAATWWNRAREFSEGELRLIEGIASQAGVALENARLFRDNQRRVEELSVLYELSQAVTGQLDRAALVQALQREVARVLDARNMVILLESDSAGELEVALRIVDGRPDESAPLRYAQWRGVGLMSLIMDTGRPLRTDDYAGECGRRGLAMVPSSTQLRHWVGVPIAAGEQILGVLALRSAERSFTEADERLLTNIAGLAALALRSARLFEDRTLAYGELAAAQDQLVRTEKLRALGEMASGVAHDFNNLLASIVGRAQLALQRAEDPTLRRWLEVIERSALDGAQAVRRLQEFTRLRRDQAFVSVDLNQVVCESLEVTETRWREEPRSRGIRIAVTPRLAGGLPPVAGDPAELREALTNLILNALDAMPGGGTLTLATRAADGRVEVAVSDTGVGMPESVKQKIFDPFFTTKGPQGTGLGLSMSYGILSRHGVTITVDSEEGRGTTFRLSFPASARVDDVETGLAPRLPSMAPLRCLVVDDEEMVGEVLGEMLASGGHDALVLSRGQEAIARFKVEPFDVVFTDLSMPGLSGWDVARSVKNLAPHVPVFLVSGFGVEVSLEDMKAHGVDAVLAKPFQMDDVWSVLAGVRPRPRG